MKIFDTIEAKFEENSNLSLKNISKIKEFLKKKFEEQPELEWIEIVPYMDDPDYPDALCKFTYQKEVEDFDLLSEEVFAWIDYLNNDLAGYLQGYENICAFAVGRIKRTDFNS